MKYKLEYIQLKYDIEDLQEELRSMKEQNTELSDESARLKRNNKYIEGMELRVAEENRWLRDTLRLIMVDADKLRYTRLTADEERYEIQGSDIKV